jgi:hypothetical protein
MTEPQYPIEDYATAWPETAQPTADEPAGDPGHLVPDDVWAAVQADVEGEA